MDYNWLLFNRLLIIIHNYWLLCNKLLLISIFIDSYCYLSIIADCVWWLLMIIDYTFAGFKWRRDFGGSGSRGGGLSFANSLLIALFHLFGLLNLGFDFLDQRTHFLQFTQSINNSISKSIHHLINQFIYLLELFND